MSGFKPFARIRLTAGVGLILSLNALVFLVFLVLRLLDSDAFKDLFTAFWLVPERLLHGEVYRLFTMTFLHDPFDPFHIILNMLLLYSLGQWVERSMGIRQFLLLYFISGLCGSILFSTWAFAIREPSLPVVGASGAVLGVLAAFSFLFPDAQLRLFFFAPLRGKWLILVVVLLDFIFWLSNPRIAIAAHLGGITGAYFFIYRPWRKSYRQKVKWRVLTLMRKLR